MKISRHLPVLSLAGLFLTLEACDLVKSDPCEGVHCSPCTLTENIDVRLDTRTPSSGFTAAEVQDAYVVRYAKPGFATPLDTLRGQLCGGNLYCSFGLQTYPLPPTTGQPDARRYTEFNYRVVLPNANRSFDLSDLEVESEPGGKGCCSCASNVRRRLVLDGVAVADDGRGNGNGIWLRR